MGKAKFFLGEVGAGAAMKLVVNMVMGSMMVAWAEGLVLAKEVRERGTRGVGRVGWREAGWVGGWVREREDWMREEWGGKGKDGWMGGWVGGCVGERARQEG
jgi:6-phosphogluconate dehydrogenase (decarboxylating)